MNMKVLSDYNKKFPILNQLFLKNNFILLLILCMFVRIHVNQCQAEARAECQLPWSCGYVSSDL